MITDSLQDKEKKFIVDIARRIIPIRSISPESGGKGESERADELCKILDEMGFKGYSRYDVEDKGGFRRSSVVLKSGRKEKTLWIVANIDTVPEGDLSLWTRSPFTVTLEKDRIYGRGTSDNGQAILLSMLLLKNLRKDELNYNLGIAFVADEEMGSNYGIQHLLEKDIFREGDLIIVPDAGTEEGNEVEVAEKSILWLKIKTTGKQYHASMPFNAINAPREGIKFLLELDRHLHEKFKDSVDIFSPPYSTFEPTKHEKNVDNINTIPGVDVQYMDCRILPGYDLVVVMDQIELKMREFEKDSKAKISYEVIQKEQAPARTPENAEIVERLIKSIRKTRNIEPKVIGIGGGTCAAYFRKKGFDAAVWCTTVAESAHKPDEYMILDHVLKDRDVIEDILYGRGDQPINAD